MLAFIYLGLAVYLGDQLCRRFYRFVSRAHRWAAAVLVGLLLSSWFTYLAAWAWAATNKPLLWADLLFFAASAGTIFFFHRESRRGRQARAVFIEPRTPGSPIWDWAILVVYLVAACWLMFATLGYQDGKLRIANNEWSDFGPNTAIVRSFSVGHNFPTQYPHFSGEPIRYHFLLYFQVGNLEFLGLNLAWGLNLLSILSLVCMLALVMSLGQLLFNSRAVGRIGSALFFFHGTLSVFRFLHLQTSFHGALHAITNLREFLPSGFPYRGELWGIWTQVVFLNQRHLASAIGIFIVVLIFLIDRYRQDQRDVEPTQAQRVAPENSPEPSPSPQESAGLVNEPQLEPGFATKLRNELFVGDWSFVFCGFLLGSLPFWNALVFTSAFAVLFLLFIFFPCRGRMVGLAVTAAVVALPQILYLRSGGVKTPTYSLFHWGYVLDNPTLANVAQYLGFTFGLKWLLIALALISVSWFHRRLFLAFSSLLLLTFLTQFSIEALANHKFLNIWLILTNLFVAYGFCRLWRIKTAGLAILGRGTAILLSLPIMAGGIIDLFPIHNGYFVEIAYVNDSLLEWVRTHTSPHDVFLSDRFVNHQILLAGRRIFYGWPSYPWSAGYDTTKRDMVYRDLFENKDPRRVFSLLHENGIAYVAFDNGVRHGEFIKHPNEQVYAKNFPKVFEDKGNKYASLTIYKIPEQAPAQFRFIQQTGGINMFEGGKGTENGQFDFPRGLAVDRSGNILISDTNNGRIEKFTATGVFIGNFGATGSGQGDFSAPDGIAVDFNNNIYVADTGNERVQKLRPDGTFLAEWKGPAPGFYGPRDICVAQDGSVYVVDQGRGRIVRFNPDGVVLAVWGTTGKDDGQFIEPTAVAVDGENDRVYVADPRNQRIQVFDSTGKIVTKWAVPEWQPNAWVFQHLIVDSKKKCLYASSLATDEILVFDFRGTKIGSLKPKPPEKLEGASAMALVNGKVYVLCTFANRVSQIDLETKP
jgi:DNA-binding beta-propeller fold protein YncE